MRIENPIIKLIYKIIVATLLLMTGFLAGYYYDRSIAQNRSENLATNLEVENDDNTLHHMMTHRSKSSRSRSTVRQESILRKSVSEGRS